MREPTRWFGIRLSAGAILLGCLLFLPGCTVKRAPEPHDDTGQAEGLSTFDFMYQRASQDTKPPEDQELRPPVIASELARPVYPENALDAGAGPATVAVRILVDTEGRVAEVADSPRLASTPGPFAADFRRAVEEALAQWVFEPACWRRFEPGEDLDGDGVADYRRAIENRAVSYYLDVRFDFEIVDGRGHVRLDQS